MGYLFPDKTLCARTSEQLRHLISESLPDALDQPDGTDASADVRIDYAQDLIQQAIDILLARDEVFSDADKQNLPFVHWPLTPEEAELAERRRLAEATAEEARREAWKAHEAALRSAAAAIVDGALPPTNFDAVAVDVSLGGADRIPGPTIVAMVSELTAILGAKPFLSYCCSRPGVTIATDPAPIGFGLHFPLAAPPAVWGLVRTWMHDRKLWTVELFDHRPIAPEHFHTSLRHLFADPPPAWGPDPLPRPAAEDDDIDTGEFDPLRDDGPVGAPRKTSRFRTLLVQAAPLLGAAAVGVALLRAAGVL